MYKFIDFAQSILAVPSHNLTKYTVILLAYFRRFEITASSRIMYLLCWRKKMACLWFDILFLVWNGEPWSGVNLKLFAENGTRRFEATSAPPIIIMRSRPNWAVLPNQSVHHHRSCMPCHIPSLNITVMHVACMCQYYPGAYYLRGCNFLLKKIYKYTIFTKKKAKKKTEAVFRDTFKIKHTFPYSRSP